MRDLQENVLSLPLCHLTEFVLFGDTNRTFMPAISR